MPGRLSRTEARARQHVNRTSAVRMLMGAGMAISLVASGAGGGAGRTSTSVAVPPRPAPLNAAACTPGSRACPIRIMFGSGAYSGQAQASSQGSGSQRWFVVQPGQIRRWSWSSKAAARRAASSTSRTVSRPVSPEVACSTRPAGDRRLQDQGHRESDGRGMVRPRRRRRPDLLTCPRRRFGPR